MTSRSLGFRLIAAASLAVLFALVVVGAGVDLSVGRHLHRSLDHSLRQRAVEIAQLSASAPALLTTPGALDASLGGQQISVEVVDRHGRIVTRSLGLGGRVLPVEGVLRSVVAGGEARYANADLGSDRLRIYVAPLANGGGPAAGGAVAVAASTHELNSTLASVHLFVLGAALVAAAAGAVALALLIRRALRPLGRLAGAAAEIERTGDPARRLPDPATRDEIGRLAQTLNAMLGSLERSRDAERRFLADASHELRTPLTALRGNVAYLARHGTSDALVADLQEDAERLATLADDLLALSREEAADVPREVVRLDELARGIAGSNPLVRVEAPNPVSVRGDGAALERALGNLVQNAERHGPAGGRISVDVHGSDGRALVSVSDEGGGLQPDEATRAFERFWRADHAKSGSGLGLAIVEATAERHGGRAYASGARFTIELPALEDPAASARGPGSQGSLRLRG
jgi:signal transduction histidine kinase